jgi:GLPGLI family protein
MRYYLKFFVSALLLCIFYSFSYQNKHTADVSSGVAFYHFFHIRDTTNTGRIWEEDFEMAFNTQKSLYTSYTKQMQDSIAMAKMEEASRSGSNQINMGLFIPSTTDKIYTSEQEKTVYVNKVFSDNNYLIKEALEKINWKIENETESLLGYTCQKATGICKGRKYTAWFTTDIPVSFGPWKLHGLPGLILEAYDDSQRIKFTCTKIKLGASVSNHMSLELPSDAVATTHSEYNRMEKAYKESLTVGAYNANDTSIDKVTVEGDAQVKNRKKFSLNYPLELTN